MATAEHLLRIVIKTDDQFSPGLKKAENAAKRLGGRMKSLGSSMTRNLTLPILGIGVAAVKAASDMDKAMRNIQSLGFETDESIRQLSETFVDMSTDINTTVDSAAGLANAFFNIKSAGFAGEEGLEILRVATKAATAGLTDTATAGEAIIGVLRAYKLEVEDASDISDLMFTTVQRGIGTFEGLAQSLSQVVPTANAANIGFDQLMAAMTTLSQQGISFREGSVAVNQAILGFLKPSDAAQDAFAAMGFASGQAMLDALGLGGAIQKMSEFSEQSNIPMTDLFGNIRALKAVWSLSGAAAEDFNENLAAMSDASGATAIAFQEQIKSFDAQLKSFKNNVTAVLIELGNIILPVLNDIMAGIKPILQAFRSLPEPVKTGIVAFLALAAAIGPLIFIFGTGISVIGSVIGFLGSMAGIMATVTAAAPALGAAITVMMGPVGLIVIGIAAAIAAGVLLVKNWDKIKTAIANFDLSEFAAKLTKFILEIPGRLFLLGIELMKGLAKGIIRGQIAIFDALVQVSKGIVDGVKSFFGISSPSTVMAGVGLDMAAGIGVGFSQGMQQVEKQVGIHMQRITSMASSGAFQGGQVGVNVFGSATSGMISNAQKAGLDFIRSRTPGLVNKQRAIDQGRLEASKEFVSFTVENINVPAGTTEEQINFIMAEIARRTQGQGV